MTHHHHCEHDSCKSEKDCACCNGTCSHHHHHHHTQDFAHELLEMADEAWMEVLKEKIMQQIESSDGKHLDELAKLVCDSNKTRWKNKLGANKSVSEFREKISEHFGSES